MLGRKRKREDRRGFLELGFTWICAKFVLKSSLPVCKKIKTSNKPLAENAQNHFESVWVKLEKSTKKLFEVKLNLRKQ